MCRASWAAASLPCCPFPFGSLGTAAPLHIFSTCWILNALSAAALQPIAEHDFVDPHTPTVKHIAGQALYQLAVMYGLIFYAPALLGIPGESYFSSALFGGVHCGECTKS